MKNLTRKVLIKILCACLMLALTCFSISLIQTNNAKATTTPTESAYARLSINDMVGYSGDGATYANGEISLSGGQSFRFNGGYKNVEVAFGVKYSAVGNLQFALRSSDGGLNGYYVLVMPNGRYYLYTNGETVFEASWPPHAGFNTTTEHQFLFKTVDLSDGSVQVTLTVDGAVFFSYNDAENQVTAGGAFVMRSDGSACVITGAEEQKPDLYDLTQLPARTSSQLPGAVVNGTTLTTANTGYSGASYAFATEGYYGYKTKVTPNVNTGAGSRLVFQIGGLGPKSKDFTTPQAVADAPWTNPGYVLYWSGNGQVHLANGNENAFLLGFWWPAAFTAGTTYDIEYYMIDLGDGTIKVSFTASVSGTVVVKIVYMDATGIVKLGNGMKTAYNTVHSIESDCVFSASESVITSNDKTLLTSQLGTPTGDSTFGRNGEVVALNSSANYNANLPENATVKFVANFSAVGAHPSLLAFSLNYQGEPGAWTSQGYSITLYANGMVNLVRNGVALCDGWLGDYTAPAFAVNTDYLFEIGTKNLGDGVLVFVRINGNSIIEYVDMNSFAPSGGWFTVFSSGFAGTLTPYGVDIPQISTALENDTATVGDQVTVNCLVGGSTPSEPVELIIDSALNSANATVSGNVITATNGGAVKVYALTGGLYSNELTITFEEPATPVITYAPETVVFGSANPVITAGMSDATEVLTKVFKVENGTGSASIDATTGELTPISAGTIKVYATINDKDTEKVTVKILPVITITNPTAKIVKGGQIDLDFTANCGMPSDVFSTFWEITEGNNVAGLNGTSGEMNGVINAVENGTFKVKVTVSSTSLGDIVSEELTLTVISPVLTNLPTAPVIVGETAPVIGAQYSDGSLATSVTYAVVNVSGSASIDATTGELTPVSAGTIRVYATVDGVNTEEYLITILPVITIERVGSFALGGSYALSDIGYEVNCALPQEEIIVTYELAEGSDLATLTATHLNMGDSVGVIGIRVILTGETFQAVSQVIRYSIEEPIVITHDQVLEDLFVGQTVTLNPQISQGGFDINSLTREIVVIEGGDLVQITGLTIKAIAQGTFKFKVKVNNILSLQEAEFAIVELVPTIIASSTMVNGKTQTATVMFNADPADYTYTTLVWSITAGTDVATVDANGLITALKEGTFTLKAVIDGVVEKAIEITVIGKVALTGVANGSQVVKGNTIQLGYHIYDENFGEVTSVEYIIVSGGNNASVSADGKLTLTKKGEVQIQVKVNGVASNVITVSVIDQDDVGEEPSADGCGCDSFIGTAMPVGIVLIATATAMLVKRNKKEN